LWELKKIMNKKQIGVYGAVGAILLGLAAFAINVSTDDEESSSASHRFSLSDAANEAQEVFLYFTAGSQGMLVAEKRRVSDPENPVEFGQLIIRELIKGPANRNLSATLPEDTTCRALYITKNGTAYADFSSALKEKHPGGTEAEMLTIYSIVNSLALNLDKIQSVKLLLEGQEIKTLAGHIDLRRPFKADMRMVQ